MISLHCSQWGCRGKAVPGIQPTVAVNGHHAKATKRLFHLLKRTQHTAVQYDAYIDTHYHFRLSC
jgi:hypothetical protein